MSYTLNGNLMSEKELVDGFYNDVFLYSEILGINDKELNVLNTKRLFDGKEEVVNQNRIYTRVTKDYSRDIIGMWRGVSSTGDTYGNSDHYWLYREDGTYSYFTKNEQGQWGTFDNILNEYVVDGDWLACHWVTTDGTDNCECWNIDKIEGDHMYWSAIREQDGKQITSTFELERVYVDPTGVVDDILGKMWSAMARYLDGQPITEKEFGKMIGTWQSKDFHANSVLQFNNDGTLLSFLDDRVSRLLYTIKDGHIYTATAGGTESKMTYDRDSDLLTAESEMIGKKFVTIYYNVSSDIAEDINASLQGGWTGMIVSFDGVVYSPGELMQHFPSQEGAIMSSLTFHSDQYSYLYGASQTIAGTTRILPTGQIEIGDKEHVGSHLMLFYRKQGDILQSQEFEIGGNACTVIFERIKNEDFTKPFALIGTWQTKGAYDGVLTSSPALIKELKRLLPDVAISDPDVTITFLSDGTGTVNMGGQVLNFNYSMEDHSVLVEIQCHLQGSGTSFVVWANKATGKIYLYGTDAVTGRNNVLSFDKGGKRQ